MTRTSSRVVRQIPHRRFDWDTREWWAPDRRLGGRPRRGGPQALPGADDQRAGRHLAARRRRALGRPRAHDALRRPRLVGPRHARRARCPRRCWRGRSRHDGMLLAPLTREGAIALGEARGARLDGAAHALRARARARRRGAARRGWRSTSRSRASRSCSRRCGTRRSATPSSACPARQTAAARCRWTRGSSTHLDGFLATHGVAVDAPAEPRAGGPARGGGRGGRRRSAARKRHRGRAADRRSSTGLGGELQPFQWAGVRYVLDARRAFLSDEQGLGKTVQALAAMEADDAYPAIVVCPASLKLNWLRETRKWLPHRSGRGRRGRRRGPEDRRDHHHQLRGRRQALRDARAAAARGRSSSTSPTTARTRAPSARRRCASSPSRSPSGGLRVALTGTPVLNHAEELICAAARSSAGWTSSAAARASRASSRAC